ncbi:MAG TPA: TlpA disulfide reductase family protein [Candidatus Angelobacter sp.]|nr:TlpA disulfide reductase family protein [Candidatus Angelobacter sp.]
MPALLLRVVAIAVLGFAFTANASDVAPDFELHDLKGSPHKLADYRGKPVVLNFWATWCVPCAKEMPLLDEMQKRYQGRVVFIAASVDFDDVKPSIAAFIKKHHADDLTVMVGADLDSLNKFGLKEEMPGTVFIDAAGNIVGRASGALKRDELETQMQKLAGAPGSLPKDGQKPAGKAAK